MAALVVVWWFGGFQHCRSGTYGNRSLSTVKRNGRIREGAVTSHFVTIAGGSPRPGRLVAVAGWLPCRPVHPASACDMRWQPCPSLQPAPRSAAEPAGSRRWPTRWQLWPPEGRGHPHRGAAAAPSAGVPIASRTPKTGTHPSTPNRGRPDRGPRAPGAGLVGSTGGDMAGAGPPGPSWPS